MLTKQCGDKFAIYTNSESLCCTPETNIMLHVHYISMKTNKKENCLQFCLEVEKLMYKGQ